MRLTVIAIVALFAVPAVSATDPDITGATQDFHANFTGGTAADYGAPNDVDPANGFSDPYDRTADQFMGVVDLFRTEGMWQPLHDKNDNQISDWLEDLAEPRDVPDLRGIPVIPCRGLAGWMGELREEDPGAYVERVPFGGSTAWVVKDSNGNVVFRIDMGNPDFCLVLAYTRSPATNVGPAGGAGSATSVEPARAADLDGATASSEAVGADITLATADVRPAASTSVSFAAILWTATAAILLGAFWTRRDAR